VRVLDLNGVGHRTGNRRSRLAVGVLYLVMSVPIGGWAARVPDVRLRVGADDAVWGLANTVPSIGNVVGLGTIVLLAGRVRGDALALAGAALVLLTVPSTAASTGVPAVVLGLTTWALVAHLMDIPMAAMALEVQRRYRRPLMGSFDAGFAAGTLAGGATGIASAALGVPPWVQFTVTSGLLGLALALTARWLPAEAPRPAGHLGASLRRRFNRRMLPIATVAFLSGYVTESSILWSAIYVTDTMDGGPVAGAAAYTAATAAGTLALLLVDRATARLGMVRLVRRSTVFAAVGLAACLAITSPVAAIVGFVVLSIGMAGVNPTVYTLAGNQGGLSASEGVSVVEVGQMPGAAIAAPALIGALSGLVGLRLALGSVVVAALLIAVLVGRTLSGVSPGPTAG
jgi:hypothetical protein